MNHDRIAGAAKKAKGTIKEAAGKILGDAKLEKWKLPKERRRTPLVG